MRLNILRFSLFVGLFCSSFPVFAQSLYQYQFALQPSGMSQLRASALLIVFPDGYATARLYYTDGSGGAHLFDIPLYDSLTGGMGSTADAKRYFVSSLPADSLFDLYGLVSDSSSKPVHAPFQPVFVLDKIVEDGIAFHTPVGMLANGVNVVDLTVQQLDFQKLRAADIAQYYHPDEDVSRELFREEAKGLWDLFRPKTMYLILVANTMDPKIGVPMVTSEKKVLSSFSHIASTMGMSLKPTQVRGAGFSRAAVEKAIKDVAPRSGDVVVFYYLGHGFRFATDKEKYPRMILSNSANASNLAQNNLSLQTVYQRLHAKGASLTLVIGDCCNTDPFVEPPQGPSTINAKPGGIPLSFDNCRKLFDLPSGTRQGYLSASSSPTQVAWCNPELGSYFTHHFIGMLQGYVARVAPPNTRGQKEVNWRNLFQDAINQTKVFVGRFNCGVPPNRFACTQWPLADINPR